MTNFFRIDQRQDMPITLVQGVNFQYRFAYSRSEDSLKENENGQDYIAINADDQRIAFALCDGVSQSFYGDLAAKFLGEQLVNWFWDNGDGLLQRHEQFPHILTDFITNMTDSSSKLVIDFSLPENIPSMLKVVLEKKRKMGSESMFVAGFINVISKQVMLSWMGDCRLRLWEIENEQSEMEFGQGVFQTKEHWSTHKGLIGSLHTRILHLNKSFRVMTYSDGLSRIDQKITRGSPSNKTIENIISECRLLPSSDDISFLEIHVESKFDNHRLLKKSPKDLKVIYVPQDNQINASWKATKKANSYDIAIRSENGLSIFSTENTNWGKKIQELPNQIRTIRVRAWLNEEITNWSDEFQLTSIIEQPEIIESKKIIGFQNYPDKNSESSNVIFQEKIQQGSSNLFDGISRIFQWRSKRIRRFVLLILILTIVFF